MPKYDAFGREIGEDTLSGLGSGASADAAPEAEAVPMEAGSPLRAPQPQPQPVFTAPPAQPQPQPQPERPFVSIPLRPPRGRRRRGVGFIVLFALFIVLAPLAIGGLVLFSAVDGATEAVRDGIKTLGTPEPAAAAPKGVSGRSLVRRDHFAAALAKLRGSELRLTHLRLAPERIDVTLLTRAGRLRNLQVQPGGAVKQFGPDSGPGFDSTATIPMSRLNAGAPQRLARRGAAKLRVPVSTLQYLVPTRFGGKVTWVAYFEHGRYVMGDAAGRYQRAYP